MQDEGFRNEDFQAILLLLNIMYSEAKSAGEQRRIIELVRTIRKLLETVAIQSQGCCAGDLNEYDRKMKELDDMDDTAVMR